MYNVASLLYDLELFLSSDLIDTWNGIAFISKDIPSKCKDKWKIYISGGEVPDAIGFKSYYIDTNNWGFIYEGVRCDAKGQQIDCRILKDDFVRARVIIAVKVLMSNLAPLRGGLVLHASCVEGDRGGYVFVGPSGAGKSTIAKLTGKRIVSDDFTPLWLVDGNIFAFPSPFQKWEKKPGSWPYTEVKSIYVLEKSDEWWKEALNRVELVEALLRNTNYFGPFTPLQLLMDQAVDFADRLKGFKLGFSLSEPPSGWIF